MCVKFLLKNLNRNPNPNSFPLYLTPHTLQALILIVRLLQGVENLKLKQWKRSVCKCSVCEVRLIGFSCEGRLRQRETVG